MNLQVADKHQVFETVHFVYDSEYNKRISMYYSRYGDARNKAKQLCRHWNPDIAKNLESKIKVVSVDLYLDQASIKSVERSAK